MLTKLIYSYIIKIENYEIGKINRSNQEIILPGGKGINVSIVLNSLGIETMTLGFIAGFTGNKIKEEIEKYNIKTDKTLLFCLFLCL